MKKYDIENVDADGNCCFYVAVKWLKKNKNISFENIDIFRKDLWNYMNDNEEALRSKKYGVDKLYSSKFWNELRDRIWIEGKNYIGGCGIEGWVSMMDIFPILAMKYDSFNLIVLSQLYTSEILSYDAS